MHLLRKEVGLLLTTRFILLLVGFSAAFVVALIASNDAKYQHIEQVLVNTKQQQGIAAKEIIQLQNAGLKTLAHDYTFWDDMVDFVGHPTQTFADENFKTCFETYNADAIWVFDAQGDLVWFSSADGKAHLKDVRLFIGKIQMAFGKRNKRRFFASSAQGTVELQASTINRTNDPERIGRTYGYFVAGAVWDDQWLARLRRIIDTQVEIVGPSAQLGQIPGSSPLDLMESLNDAEGAPVAKLFVSSKTGTVRLMSDSGNSEIVWLLGFSVVFVVLVGLCLTLWVTQPLSQITKALRLGDPEILHRLKKNSTEFGRLAGIVEESFRQASALELEVVQRKMAQAELIKIRKAIDCASDAITIADAEGKVIYVNQAYTDLFGFTAADVTALGGFGSLLGEDLRNRVREQVLSGHVWEGESEVSSRTGERVAIAWRTAGVRDEIGRNIGMISVVVDMRERNQLQRRVVQAEKLAALGELVAGVAHEINNPLAAISGHAQLLEMHADASVREDGKSIKRMTDRSHKIIQSLLTFSRESAIDKRNCRLREPIESALELCGYRLRTQGIAVEIDIEDEPAAWINEQQVHQVMLNLLNNAAQAMKSKPVGEKRIVIAAGIQLASGHPFIRVSDTGCGIEPEILERIFDPFFTTKDIGEGTGLGLAICHGIIVEHQGQFNVKSEVGVGTVFTIVFPPAPAHEAAA